MQLYHRTLDSNIATILAEGFRDGEGLYGTGEIHTGVWLSDVVLSDNEGTIGDAVLSVELEESLIARFEWVQEPSFGYREWLIPSSLVNEHGVVRLLSEEQVDELTAQRWADI